MPKQRNASISSSTKSNRSLKDATCVETNPRLFDSTDWTKAKYALSLCAVCTVRDLCLLAIDPMKNSYDGVAGGYLWANGRPLSHEYEVLNELVRPFADKDTLDKYMRKELQWV